MDIFITPRLTIRPPLEVDGDALVAHLNDPKVTCNLLTMPKPYRAEDAAAFLERISQSEDQRGYVLVRERAIGMIGLKNYNAETKTAHLGYWLASHHHGKGLMTEGLSKVVQELFGEGWVTTLESTAFEDNAASQKMQHKLGFQFLERTQSNNRVLLQTRLEAEHFTLPH